MGNALLSKRGGGYAKIKFEDYFPHIIPTALSVARDNLAATTVGDYALFGGGYGFGSTYCSTVDAYNSSLTRSIPTALNQEREDLAATTVGNYALFGGGSSYSSTFTYYSTVDAYSSVVEATVYPGSKYKFQNMQSESTSNAYQILNIPVPATGYVKIKNTTLSQEEFL